jgi:hypothetical protein
MITVISLDKHPRPSDVGTELYSNFDHTFYDEGRVRILHEEPPAFHQHAALEYCGWVFRTGGVFVEIVMRYGDEIAAYESDDLDVLIQHVIDAHGAD